MGARDRVLESYFGAFYVIGTRCIPNYKTHACASPEQAVVRRSGGACGWVSFTVCSSSHPGSDRGAASDRREEGQTRLSRTCSRARGPEPDRGPANALASPNSRAFRLPGTLWDSDAQLFLGGSACLCTPDACRVCTAQPCR
eukprot:1439187-Rhodomonas_salina.1